MNKTQTLPAFALGSRVRHACPQHPLESGPGTVIGIYPATQHEPAGVGILWDNDPDQVALEYDITDIMQESCTAIL
jgi:hypothetical protein